VTYVVNIRNDTTGPVTINSVDTNITGGPGTVGFTLASCNASAGGNSCTQISPGDPAIVWNAAPPVVLAIGNTLTITIQGGFFGVLGPPPPAGQGCVKVTRGSTTPSFPLNQNGPCVTINP